MPSISTFILSVAANVASYYICKWLDGWFTGRKHSKKEDPLSELQLREGGFLLGESND